MLPFLILLCLNLNYRKNYLIKTIKHVLPNKVKYASTYTYHKLQFYPIKQSPNMQMKQLITLVTILQMIHFLSVSTTETLNLTDLPNPTVILSTIQIFIMTVPQPYKQFMTSLTGDLNFSSSLCYTVTCPHKIRSQTS